MNLMIRPPRRGKIIGAGKKSDRQLRQQAEKWEQRRGVEKIGHCSDAIAGHLEHDERPGLPATLTILAEGGGAAGCRRHQSRPAAARASKPGANRIMAAQPQRVRRHRHGRVLGKQRRQRMACRRRLRGGRFFVSRTRCRREWTFRGLESDGGDQFFCGAGRSGKVRTVRRPVV